MEQLGVSVIIPVYKGKRYITYLLNTLYYNFKNLISEKGIESEVIFVNDYPDEPLEIELSWNHKMNIQILNLPENHGIHGARINGLSMAKGRYILFLDQDDQIAENYIVSQLNLLGDADGILCNGYIVRYCVDGKKVIYSDAAVQKQATEFKTFINQGNRILSPGQMLVRKSSIPALWKEVVMRRNGADDYLLWVLMLQEGKKININEERLYTHIGQGINSSQNVMEMQSSLFEMIHLLEEHRVLTQTQMDILRHRVENSHDRSRQQGIIVLYDLWMHLAIRNIHIADYLINQGMTRIVVYGMNYVGNRLYDELKNSEVEIIAGIDKNADSILYEIPVLKLQDAELESYLKTADAIVVTAVTFYEEIKKEISVNHNIPIISMNDILLEMIKCGK